MCFIFNLSILYLNILINLYIKVFNNFQFNFFLNSHKWEYKFNQLYLCLLFIFNKKIII